MPSSTRPAPRPSVAPSSQGNARAEHLRALYEAIRKDDWSRARVELGVLDAMPPLPPSCAAIPGLQPDFATEPVSGEVWVRERDRGEAVEYRLRETPTACLAFMDGPASITRESARHVLRWQDRVLAEWAVAPKHAARAGDWVFVVRGDRPADLIAIHQSGALFNVGAWDPDNWEDWSWEASGEDLWVVHAGALMNYRSGAGTQVADCGEHVAQVALAPEHVLALVDTPEQTFLCVRGMPGSAWRKFPLATSRCGITLASACPWSFGYLTPDIVWLRNPRGGVLPVSLRSGKMLPVRADASTLGEHPPVFFDCEGKTCVELDDDHSVRVFQAEPRGSVVHLRVHAPVSTPVRSSAWCTHKGLRLPPQLCAS